MSYRRATGVFLVFIACFAVLVTRLFALSIRDGESISITVQRQQQYLFTIAAKRGTIYDCQMRPLTYTGNTKAVLVQPAVLTDAAKSAKYLAYAAECSKEEMEKKLSTGRPFSFLTNVLMSEENGIAVMEIPTRTTDLMATHTLGTVNEDENIGLSGIEAACNEILSEKAELYVSTAVDAQRREIVGEGVSIFSDRYYGENGIVLTLDQDLQKIAEQAANIYLEKGAIALCEIETGELKAVVSMPDYDPRYVERYLDGENGALLNRALQRYNLGSIFKIVVTAAAHESSTILQDKIYCNGGIKIGSRTIGCHQESGHGWVDMTEGFKQSCNPYFIQQGIATGLNTMLDMARRFGLYESISLWDGYATKTPVMPEEYAGENPSKALVANTAIGQGDILLSPLHALQIVNVIASGGLLHPLELVKGQVEDGTLQETAEQEAVRIISEETAQYVQNLMMQTMESGTGSSAHLEGYEGGGKTGSAETGQRENDEPVVHGWYAGYFPAENPKYSLVVFAENGKSGASACGPLFKYIGDRMAEQGYLG